MNRLILASVLFFTANAALGAQEASQSSPYQGTSNPPADDQITTTTTQEAKPPAGQPAVPVPAPAQSQTAPQSNPVAPAANYQPANDDGIVHVANGNPSSAQPELSARAYASDPDGDIVHPRSLRPGELREGTTIRVRLLDRLSTATSEKGEPFTSRVATDVLQGDKVLIPAGSEIDGRVVDVSSGHAGGHGSMRLKPETVILPDGSKYRLHAETTGTPGSRTHMGGESTIVPDSRAKRDGIEYGGAVGAGAVTGAIVAGPVGALTGSLIGAGVVTAHLLISHPQATLESGTTMLFTLTEPLDMVRAGANAN